MSCSIFYFTATGNSLNMARQIADGLGGAELIAMPTAIERKTDAGASVIGLVFPVFAWGMPRMVEDFVKKLQLNREQYVFAVATCGGTPATTLLQLRKLLRKSGADLDAGFTVREGSVASASDPAMIRLVRGLNWKKPGTGTERLPEIIREIKAGQKHRPESSSLPANFLGGLFHGAFAGMAKTSDKNYIVDDKCNQCGICARACPRSNITIVDGRPSWHHDCEMCGTCYQWCPKKAIRLRNGETNYYHHPEVKLKDVLLR